MSFESCMRPYLNSQSSEDKEWYIRATHQALNAYMGQLEAYMRIPQNNMVNGVTTVPGTPPTPVTIKGPLAYFSPNGIRLTYSEVKTAMFCGDPDLCFINLFNIFGQKFSLNFITVNARPTLNVAGFCTIPTHTWMPAAQELISEARAIGADMTPETFCELESSYLQMAIQNIPSIPVPLVGAGLLPIGAFVGTATMQFGRIIV